MHSTEHINLKQAMTQPDHEIRDDESLLGDIALRLMLKNELDSSSPEKIDMDTKQKNIHAKKMMKIQESSTKTQQISPLCSSEKESRSPAVYKRRKPF